MCRCVLFDDPYEIPILASSPPLAQDHFATITLARSTLSMRGVRDYVGGQTTGDDRQLLNPQLRPPGAPASAFIANIRSANSASGSWQGHPYASSFAHSRPYHSGVSPDVPLLPRRRRQPRPWSRPYIPGRQWDRRGAITSIPHVEIGFAIPPTQIPSSLRQSWQAEMGGIHQINDARYTPRSRQRWAGIAQRAVTNRSEDQQRGVDGEEGYHNGEEREMQQQEEAVSYLSDIQTGSQDLSAVEGMNLRNWERDWERSGNAFANIQFGNMPTALGMAVRRPGESFQAALRRWTGDVAGGGRVFF